MRLDESAVASSSCDDWVVDTLSMARASPAAIGRMGGFVAIQFEGYTVVGRPRSSHPVDTPSSIVAVVRNPFWLYEVTTLNPEPEQDAAGDGAGDSVDEAGWDVDWEQC